MSDNKKYYYLKIKENFYDTEDIKILQSMDNGYLYSDILMKLYLKSLKSEGKLMFKDHIPYNCNMIATVTGHNTVIVEKALSIFKELGLIDILDNGAIFMLDIQNFIGQSSSEGDRKRVYRKKIETEKILLLQGGQMSEQMSDEQPPEIEKEIEIDIEEDIEKEKIKSKNKKGSDIDTLINNYTDLPELQKTLRDFIIMRKELKKPLTTRALELLLDKINKIGTNDYHKIQILEQSIMNSWQGVFELKQDYKSSKESNNPFINMMEESPF